MKKFIVVYRTYCGKTETTWVYANSLSDAASQFRRCNGGNTIIYVRYA
jgi:hypothetical protein